MIPDKSRIKHRPKYNHKRLKDSPQSHKSCHKDTEPIRDKFAPLCGDIILLLILFCMACGAAECWTSKTYEMVVVQSAKVMPLSFRNIMYQHKKDILSGALVPDQPANPRTGTILDSRSGYLYDAIADLVKKIPKKINERAPVAKSHSISQPGALYGGPQTIR